MKNFRNLMLLVAFLGLGAAFTACGGHSHDQDGEQTEQQGPEYTSDYICPMHCEGSGSDEPGKCPVCGMDYVKNEETDSDEHSHDGHDHDHNDHEGHVH